MANKITVSASYLISEKKVEDFVYSKADFIIKAIEKFEHKSERTSDPFFTKEEIKNIILELCDSVYPYFEKMGVKYPQIKFRTMKTRWGSCNPSKNIITFNNELMYAPKECIEYVVKHEFTHFLQPNHSKKFYLELEKICPDWKDLRNKLKNINVM